MPNTHRKRVAETSRCVVLIARGENDRRPDAELAKIIGRKDNNFMGCKMVFRRILILMLFWAWLQPARTAERNRLVDDEGSSSNLTQGYALTPDPDDGNDDDYATQGVECYQAKPEKLGKFIQYTFWDHIVVNTRYTQSRCIILKDVPFSGFYNIDVYAGYSIWEGAEEEKEEYRLVIDLGDTLVEGPVIPDQFDGLVPGSTENYVWIWNPHGYQYLHKGDNLIYFRKGNQVNYSNSVDLRRIRLLPPPHIIEEPKFTRGTTNTVRWMPIDEGDYTQEVFYFDTTAPSPGSPNQQLMLSKAIPSQYKDAFFSGLEDGHRYGYYVETFLTPNQPVYSDTTYSTQDATPPGLVHIDSLSAFANRRVQLFWNSVADAVSGVKKYQILRFSGAGVDTVANIPVDAACTLSDKYDYCTTDLLPVDAAGTRECLYRIDAVDLVDNRSTGVLSELVLGIPAPQLAVTPPPAFEHYYKGAIVTVAVDISSLQLPESHFVKFQAARDSVKYLDDEWQLNKYFFDSGWLAVKETPKILEYSFDLSNGGKEKLSFIDGHR
ncbi:MAG: hypothetical protein EHM72_19750, partial [Calditrichaeota bacterium]